MTMLYDVFLSYKRDGGAEEAELVRSELLKRGFRRSRIFMDTYNVGEGKFPVKILEALKESEAVVVIITRRSLDGVKDESNWILEIRTAMELGKKIVPVYFDDIRELDRSLLPESIRDFPDTNAVPYVHQYAKASFDYLKSLLRKPFTVPRKVKVGAGVTAGLAAVATAVALLVPGRDTLNPGEVFVIESSTSKCYHMDKGCWGLKNASHRLKIVTLEEAEQMGKRPCSKCCK